MKNLFTINSDERKRILEMHENATKRQYLNEIDEVTGTTSPTTVSPKLAPISISELKGKNNKSFKLYKNNKQIDLQVEVEPVQAKTTKPSFFIKISNESQIPKLKYTFFYTCDRPDELSLSEKTIPTEVDLAGITAIYDGKLLENKKQNFQDGSKQITHNPLITALSRLKEISLDISQFTNIPSCV